MWISRFYYSKSESKGIKVEYATPLETFNLLQEIVDIVGISPDVT